MNYYSDPKEMSTSMNSRMMINVGAVFSIINGIFPNLMQGVSFTGLAKNAEMGDAKAIELLQTGGFTSGSIKMLGIICILTAAITIICSMLCLKFSNNLKKMNITLIAIVVTIVSLAGQQLLLLLKFKMVSVIGMISTLLIPAVMLWSVIRLLKIAKQHPEREYAVLTKKLQQNMNKTRR